MFCHKCGSRQDTSVRFCSICGTQLRADEARSPKVEIRLPDLSKLRNSTSSLPRPGLPAGRDWGAWRPLSGSGGLLLLIGFFLPWVSASCEPGALGMSAAQARDIPRISFTGFELAVGPKVPAAFGPAQQLPATPSLWLVLVAALVILLVAAFAARRQVGGGIALGAAIISVIPLLNIWQSFESQRNAFIRITIELGLWMSIIGIVGAAIGGVIALISASSASGSRAPDRFDQPHSANRSPG